MTILIITSSYPSTPDDSTAAAGLFVRDFARELNSSGHKVIILAAARKKVYLADPGLTIVPLPWLGGDHELASMNFLNPFNWFIILHFLWSGCRETARAAKRYEADRSLCMWAVPSGIFGLWAKRKAKVPYDVWALGSDIWRIRKFPGGRGLLRWILSRAEGVFADGMRLKDDVEQLTGRECQFLPSARKLPAPESILPPLEPTTCKHFLFVGRYHRNKGPDILIDAVALLPDDAKRRIRLHMFGVGPLKELLVSQIKRQRLENVVDVGDTIPAQELSNFLARCDYVVIPSRIESVPVILSDAAQGLVPAIASEVGDMAWLVSEYKAGITFAGSPESCRDALLTAIGTESSQFAAGSGALAAQFQLDAIADSWLKGLRFSTSKREKL